MGSTSGSHRSKASPVAGSTTTPARASNYASANPSENQGSSRAASRSQRTRPSPVTPTTPARAFENASTTTKPSESQGRTASLSETPRPRSPATQASDHVTAKPNGNQGSWTLEIYSIQMSLQHDAIYQYQALRAKMTFETKLHDMLAGSLSMSS